VSRILLLVGVSAAGFFFLLTGYGRKKFSDFFALEVHPLNFAVFRFTLFLTLFLQARFMNPLWFNQIPAELLAPPWGLGWVVSYLPMDQTLLIVSYLAFLFFCITGMIGFFSRTSAFFVTVLGLFVIGVSQMYGKLNHDHHILWFSALLACSRSADMFSFDAIFSAFRRADQGRIEPPERSKIYGTPVAFILLLIGILYFFPGFWKIWQSGIEWIWGDNLKFQLYMKWIEYPDWTPFFRIDQHVVLMRLVALATVLFELSFLFFLFFPKLRMWQGLAGSAFHNGTYSFMRIPFWQLQTCYVIFFDWDRIFRGIGRVLFPETMYVVYDGNCKLCRRTIAAIRVFDIFGRIEYVNALVSTSLGIHPLAKIDREALLKDMHVVTGKKVWRGYNSYRALTWRIPLFWLALPFLYVCPVTSLGNWIYRRIADFRTCPVSTPPSTKQGKDRDGRSLENRALLVLGCFLIAINSWFGIQDIHSWPFSVYPAFKYIIGDERLTVRIEAEDANGTVLLVNEKEFRKKLTSSRWQAFLSNALKIQDPEKQRVYLKALWKFCVANDSHLREVRSIRFYRVVLTGNPSRRALNPLSRELLFQWDDPPRL